MKSQGSTRYPTVKAPRSTAPTQASTKFSTFFVFVACLFFILYEIPVFVFLLTPFLGLFSLRLLLVIALQRSRQDRLMANVQLSQDNTHVFH